MSQVMSRPERSSRHQTRHDVRRDGGRGASRPEVSVHDTVCWERIRWSGSGGGGQAAGKEREVVAATSEPRTSTASAVQPGRLLQRGPRLRGEPGDQRLDPVDGAGVGDDAAQLGHAVGVEVGLAEERLEQGRPGGVGAASRAWATSTVRLPSRRSSPAGLPVALGVAEHAEQVVAQLERLAERQAVRRTGAPGRPPPTPPTAAPMSSGCSTVYFALL